uniref:Uncharacterized protein n=1 Tax=Arundo donax TaxID=35708 RepID=A0A0A9B6P7_ARUDO
MAITITFKQSSVSYALTTTW